MRPTGRIAILLFLLPLVAFAQVKESVTVSVVEVPVTVVDREGNPVRGLTAANFQLFDEGKSRPITALDSIDFASAQSMSAISPMNPAARRNFMILFDLSFSSPLSLTRAEQAARDFVAKSVGKRDRVAVATIDAQKGFRLLSAFTSDRKLVAEAIENPQSFHGNDPLQVAGTIPMERTGKLVRRRRHARSTGDCRVQRHDPPHAGHGRPVQPAEDRPRSRHPGRFGEDAPQRSRPEAHRLPD